MKEISKKDLTSKINEGQFDIDEMGYTPRFQKTATQSGRLERGQGKKKIDPVTGKEIEPQASRVKPLIHPTMSVAKNEKEKYPMAYVLNTSRKLGEGTIVVAVGESTEEELMKNKEFTDWFEDVVVPLVGVLTPEKGTIHFVDFIATGHQKAYPEYLQKPSSEEFRNAFAAQTGVDLNLGIGTKELTPKTYFLLSFRKPMEEFMDSVQEKLYLSGFPPINYPTQDPGHQKRGFNTYSKIDNDESLVQSHSVYTYDNYPEFMKSALGLIKLNNLPDGEEKNIEISDAEYQARQYNAGVNWSVERKQIKTGSDFKRDPLTKVYKLDRRGMKAEEKDYVTMTTFTMKGEMLPTNQFRWEGTVSVEISEKLREQSGGQLKPVIEFTAATETSHSDGISVDSLRSVLDNPKVMRALKAVLENIASQIDTYSKNEGMLQLKERIFKTRDQVTKMKMDENEIVNLVKSVIKENKGGYEVYHDSYTSAINAAKEYAKKKGYEINDDESFRKIGMGPKKPSEGKTNRFSIELTKDGKEQKKMLHIQVYGMKSKYELNTYIS
jgi:hypothetical protein